jgi:dTDP-4-dehydrorhamnose reductase
VTIDTQITQVIDSVRPEVIFFPAAEANVDWCETHADEARALNVVPALATLAAARERGARFLFFSTDYVFDGRDGPYTEDDPVNPQSIYAKHKYEVERHVLDLGETVVRTSSVFGRELAPGKNFVLRVAARLAANQIVTAPDDQLSTPTWADELATAAMRLVDRGGMWHVAGPDLLARDELARLVATVFGFDLGLVRSVSTSELRQAAPRPMHSGLKSDKLTRETGLRLLPLRTSLERLRDSR